MLPRFKVVIGLFSVISLTLFAIGVYVQILGAKTGFSGSLIQSVSVSLLGFAMCVAAVALLIFGIHQVVEESNFVSRRELYPKEPWRWREKWASNILESAERFPFGAMVAAILWNVVTVTLTIVAFPAFAEEPTPAKWFLLCLPLIGFCLAIYAITTITRWIRFGSTTFVLDEVPIIPGDVLSGTAFTAIPADQQPEDGFLVSLSCYRIISRQRMSFKAEKVLLWRDERRFEGKETQKHQDVLAIPVHFRLPQDSLPTSFDDDPISWELKITSKVGMLLYKSGYELPVFETEAATRNRLVSWMRNNIANMPAFDSQPLAGEINRGIVGDGITIERAMDETRFSFGRARHKLMAGIVTFTTVVWSVLIAVLHSIGISTLLNLMVIGVGVSLLYGSLVLWLFESHLSVSSKEIKLVRGPFGFGLTKRLPSSDVADVVAEPTTKAGDTYLYSLYVVDRSGKKMLVAGELEEKIKTEWLAFQIKASATSLGFVGHDGETHRDRDAIKRLDSLNRQHGQADRPPRGRTGSDAGV